MRNTTRLAIVVLLGGLLASCDETDVTTDLTGMNKANLYASDTDYELDKYFLKTPRSAIEDFNLGAPLENVTPQECAQACLEYKGLNPQNPACESFDFHRDTSVCYLNSTKLNLKQWNEPWSNYDHYSSLSEFHHTIEYFSHEPNGAIPSYNLGPALKKVTPETCALACARYKDLNPQSDPCVSFDYHRSSEICYLNSKKASDLTGGLAKNSPFDEYDHYSYLPQFHRTKDAAISGHNHDHLSNIATAADCADACLTHPSIDCVSFDYYKYSQKCDLSTSRAQDVGGLKTNYDNNPYDHYRVRNEGISLFNFTGNAAISGYNKEHLHNVSAVDCAEACLAPQRKPWCVSFDYKRNDADPENGACDLSDRRAFDIGTLKTNYPNDPYDHYSLEVPPNPIPGNKHVLLIGIDGLRGDSITCSGIDTNVCAGCTDTDVANYTAALDDAESCKGGCAETQALQSLVADGTFYDNVVAGGPEDDEPEDDTENPCYQATYSGPGWASVFTGYWSNRHKVTGNHDYQLLDEMHVFDRIKQSFPTASTAVVSDWVNLTRNLLPMKVDEVYSKGLMTLKRNVEVLSKESTDVVAMNKVKDLLSWENAPTAIFYYIHNVDMHKQCYAPGDALYQERIQTADEQIGEVLATLAERIEANEENTDTSLEKENWLVVVTSDHGGKGDSHGGDSPQEKNTFLILNNNYRNQNQDPEDLYASGLNSDPMWQIDGATPHILDFLELDYHLDTIEGDLATGSSSRTCE